MPVKLQCTPSQNETNVQCGIRFVFAGWGGGETKTCGAKPTPPLQLSLTRNSQSYKFLDFRYFPGLSMGSCVSRGCVMNIATIPSRNASTSESDLTKRQHEFHKLPNQRRPPQLSKPFFWGWWWGDSKDVFSLPTLDPFPACSSSSPQSRLRSDSDLTRSSACTRIAYIHMGECFWQWLM